MILFRNKPLVRPAVLETPRRHRAAELHRQRCFRECTKGRCDQMALGPGKLAQLQLVPVDSVFCGPTGFNTADSSEGCFCSDGAAYLIKKNEIHNPKAAHNEWFCASLGVHAGVPIAPFNLVKHTNGELWFGSQYRVGEIADWWMKVVEGTIVLTDVLDDLSRIYAFDLFTFNVDRHIKNFLVVPGMHKTTAFAIDHGRAWCFSGFPLGDPPFDPASNTMNAFTWMKKEFEGYPDPKSIVDVLDKIGAISADTVKDMLNSQPLMWLPQGETDAIVDWWSGGGATNRVIKLIDGVNNGSLL